MSELLLMQELDGIAELVADVTHVIHRIRLVVVVLEEVEYTETQDFKCNARVTVEIEPVQDLDA
jgi:hypothetical protein